MSDLSWLNPTPHAIAVYASHPLSPVATQHSLPSGRYSLLGPDFHRSDRTSLRLAHSFGHFHGVADQAASNTQSGAAQSAFLVADNLTAQVAHNPSAPRPAPRHGSGDRP